MTTLCWKPDGLVFAVGHDDGCIAIWAVEDSDKPLSVRTVILEDVNVTDAEAVSALFLERTTAAHCWLISSDKQLFESGVLDKQEPSGKSMQVPIGREPIFKLSWASFPDQATLKAIAAAEGTEAAGEPVSAATYEYADRGETILVVLGGLLPTDEQGVTVLQFPAYNPPTANVRPPNLPGASQISSVLRSAFRDSLSITGEPSFSLDSPLSPPRMLISGQVQRFIQLPRPVRTSSSSPGAAPTIRSATTPSPSFSCSPPTQSSLPFRDLSRRIASLLTPSRQHVPMTSPLPLDERSSGPLVTKTLTCVSLLRPLIFSFASDF